MPFITVGEAKDNGIFTYKEISINVEEAVRVWSDTLEKVFPTKATSDNSIIDIEPYKTNNVYVCKK